MYDTPPGQPEEQMTEATRRRWEATNKRRGGQYLAGPIPIPWLVRALQLPRNTIQTAVAIWFKAGVERRKKGLRLPPNLLRRFGVSPAGVSRGLSRLVEAGLITAERHKGRAPFVTILEVKESKSRKESDQ